ncbi:MAG: thymidine phosphorylase [Acidobacteriota bacterium]
MNAVEIIRKKRDGLRNTPEEISFLVRGAIQGDIPTYQITAWLMAVFLGGMEAAETMALTQSFIQSGQVVDLSAIGCYKVDKHSTGGVGDKTSLVVAPIVAAAGLAVPMISGRGLGHTGGTLDKLESIPGFRTGLSLCEFRGIVARRGLAIMGPTEELAPADRLFYGLRDVTATVESVPLIVASILSKKAAEGIDGLVLDVKTGSGAFMKDFAASRELARKLVGVGRRLGQQVVAVISDMSQPLGRKVGNALEVAEAIEVLRGGGPEDLTRLCLELSGHMLLLGRRATTLEEARRLALEQIENGRGLEKFAEMVAAQGGDPRAVEGASLPVSKSVYDYTAKSTGYVREVRAEILGECAMMLGAGRETVDSQINPAVGLTLYKKRGDWVTAGEPLLRLHYDEESRFQRALRKLPGAYRIGQENATAPPLIREVIH